MGSVFKKTATKPLPEGAELITRKGERYARWKDRNGKKKTAPVTTGRDGSDRIVVTARTFTAKYRDGQGIVREEPTGCRDETAARQVLQELVQRADKVRSGMRTKAEDAAVDHQRGPLADHIADYLEHLEANGYSKTHRDNVARHLRRIREGCRFACLADLDRNTLEKWLVLQTKRGMGARTRNMHLASAVAFANWCLQPENSRMLANPFTGIAKASEKADCRRMRRALFEGELVQLLDVARRRPLLDAMTIRRGKNKGKLLANVSEGNRLRLEQLGRERALIYKTMVLTGLRKGELATLEVGQLELSGPVPYLTLDPDDEKNREGSEIPLRRDLAIDLRGWLEDKLTSLQDASRRRGEPIPSRLPMDAKVFRVPDKLVRILDRDLKLAGIPKVDDRGRSIDVHALRHSFGTLLSKGGVPPRTAQAAMRHSTIDLTMNNYTDPRLLDVHGALDALPALPIDANGSERERATGTAGRCVGLHQGLHQQLTNVVNRGQLETRGRPPHSIKTFRRTTS